MVDTLRIGIDLGGTKIAAIALGPDGETLAQTRIAAPSGDYAATLDALHDIVREIESLAGGTGTVGIGIPGSISPATGLVQNANSTWLNARPLNPDLEKRLGRPARLANDANCFALSEATDGAGEDAACVFGAIIGTGCGGGIVHNGKLMDGPRGIGGEWGHTPLPWTEAEEHPGPRCWCGRRGCIESWVSGPALSRDHERLTGQSRDAEDIAQKASSGDSAARESLDRHASRLARALAVAIDILDPDVIVLGGGLSEMAHLYDELPKRIAPHIFADNREIEIRRPVHGSASGVRGAAWLWDTP